MSKRLELQSVFRNPQADEEMIRANLREVFQLEDASGQLEVDYQFQIRRILSPDQLRNCPNQAD